MSWSLYTVPPNLRTTLRARDTLFCRRKERFRRRLFVACLTEFLRRVFAASFCGIRLKYVENR